MNGLLSRLSLRTAGESHGPAMVAILEGLPRGLELDFEAINSELRRRQGGAGRGGRQRLEDDQVQVLGGLRRGRTIGSPLCLMVANRDHTIDDLPEPVRPRPGHADLAGCYRYLDRDIRSTLERASARETCARVAAGAVAMQLLAQLDVEVYGFVRSVGSAELSDFAELDVADLPQLRRSRDGSRLYTLDSDADQQMLSMVQQAAERKETVGGSVEVHAFGLLPGLGSCLQWNERLDARLGAALLSIPAFKAVDIGGASARKAAFGSAAHDAILPQSDEASSLARASNRAGGLEGGMTNGQNLVVSGVMKPIATLRQPLPSVDLTTGKVADAGYERSDVCAISAASVVAQSMVALVLADAMLQRVGGETLTEFRDRGRRLWAEVRQLGAGESAAPPRG